MGSVYNDSDAREARFCDEMARMARIKKELEEAKRKHAEKTGNGDTTIPGQDATKARRPITKG